MEASLTLPASVWMMPGSNLDLDVDYSN